MLDGRKGINSLIILILIIIVVNPVSGSSIYSQSEKEITWNLNNGNIFYVGGSGPNNYTKIQDAIDNASNGDTVFVYDDSSPYKEAIYIRKKINLIGANKEKTIIDGGKNRNVVYISTNKVNISGFTIENSSKGPYRSAGIFVKDSNDIVIRENIIVNNMYGILFAISNIHLSKNRNCSQNPRFSNSYSNTNNTIILNKISYNNFGLSLGGSSENYIKRNNISHNDEGINLYSIYIGAGFEITSSQNKIKSNNIINNIKNSNDKCCNRWIRNYWDDWVGLKYELLRFLPYRIPGKLFCNFDWKPAIVPYDI